MKHLYYLSNIEPFQMLIYLSIIIICQIDFINSVIKFNIEINNEIYTLDHEDINNTTETFELTKKNFYICEDKKDCITCSFSIYEYANCYWDCDHNRCLISYSSSSFSAIIDLKEIYSTCSSCDITSNENMNKNCDSRILVEENFDNDKDNNSNDTSNIIEYSKIDFMGLLCKYNLINKYSKRDSIFHLNITKFYRYINMYLELDYGLYTRHINLKTQKNYDIDSVGVNSMVIYIYTPENYETQPFSITYSFKLLKNDKILNAIIISLSIIIVIFSFLLILIFIEIYKGKMLKHGRREYILGANTLIFNRIRYHQNLFKNCNEKCFFCGNIITENKFVAQMKCKKHIYHYGCLMKWIRENMLDNTNFFCPMCQNEQLHEISGTNISRDDNDNLLNNNTSNNINISNNNHIDNMNKKDEIDDKSNNELLSKKINNDRISNITSIKCNTESNNINNEIVSNEISFDDKKERNIDNNIDNNEIKEKENDNNINNEIKDEKKDE